MKTPSSAKYVKQVRPPSLLSVTVGFPGGDTLVLRGGGVHTLVVKILKYPLKH